MDKLRIIYPKPSKMLKYLQVVVKLLEDGWANKRQLQVAASGLVYVSMFRRPLLGSLNAGDGLSPSKTRRQWFANLFQIP